MPLTTRPQQYCDRASLENLCTWSNKTDKPQIDQAFYRVASPQLKCGHNWDKALHFPKFYGLVSIPAEKPQRKMAKMPVLKRKCLRGG